MTETLALTDLRLTEDDVAAVLDVYTSGWLTMGPRTEAFERTFAEHHGVTHAIAVSSGTAALHLTLLAAGIGAGDEVLVPATTFVADAAAVRYCGAEPVFVDSVGPADLGIDPEDAAARVGPRTRAILATHWLGYTCDLTALARLCDAAGLILVEDCAQSVLARDAEGRLAGTVGRAGCFSFFSKKQLACGEGGMVITDDDGLARDGALAALARDELDDLGAPPWTRRELRHHRHRLQLPHGRAARRAGDEPLAAPGR